MKKTQPEIFKPMSRITITLLAAFLLGACHSLGPDSIRRTHGRYGEAIATSLNEQFLQNIVRLRYREAPYFLEVGSVTSSLNMSSSLGAESVLSTGSGPDLINPEIGSSYSTSPTISYTPLQGEDFLRKVLVSIPTESLFVLMQSGWSAERVFGICVEEVNGVQNAPSASGPTPSQPPADFSRFDRLLALLEEARSQRLLRYGLDPESTRLILTFEEKQGRSEVGDEIRKILGLESGKKTYTISSNASERSPDTITIRTRSIMSILFYLSQLVEAPPSHEEDGLVTITRHSDGSRYNWRATPAGRQFQVRQRKTRPPSAYLSVPYRGYWYSIPSNDLDAKSTFMLVSQLFSLSAGSVEGVKPTLTIPVAR